MQKLQRRCLYMYYFDHTTDNRIKFFYFTCIMYMINTTT